MDVNKTIHESLRGKESLYGEQFFKINDQNLRSWVGTQKAIVDLLAGQTAEVARMFEDKTFFSKPAETMAAFFQRTGERFNETGKTILDYAAAQQKVFGDAVSKDSAVVGSPIASMADAVSKSFDRIIDAQKEVIETGAKVLNTFAEKSQRM